MADYSRQIANAAKALKKKGMPVVFIKVTESTEYDPVLDGYAKSETRYPIYGLRDTAGVAEVQGGGFSVGSTTLYIAADVVRHVDTTDYVLFGGHKWDILKVLETAPADVPILFLLELKDAGEAQ